MKLLAILLSFTLYSVALPAERGVFGLELTVNVDINSDRSNPTLTTMKIDSVKPDLPGDLAGIVGGDEIVEIEGRTIAGSKASEIRPLMNRTVGESIELKIKHPDGRVTAVTLIAVRAGP